MPARIKASYALPPNRACYGSYLNGRHSMLSTTLDVPRPISFGFGAHCQSDRLRSNPDGTESIPRLL